MKKEFVEHSVNGKFRTFPAMSINGVTIIVLGKCLKTAIIKGEEWLESEVRNPELIVARLHHEHPCADIFRFSQKLPRTNQEYQYHLEWTNVAAIPIASFSIWWEKLPQVTRKNIRRAERRGTVVRRVDFNDTLIEGIVKLNNSTPIRQGRPFSHYGKNFEEAKKDYSAYPERSEFLGAYYQNELIGLLRLIHMGEITAILQLLCMPQHADKRPANALIARAVEICADRREKYLIYGQYIYGQNIYATLTEFKKRNGFNYYEVPSYYVPLTLKGKIAIRLRLHMGIKNIIPKSLMRIAFKLRRLFIRPHKKYFSDEDNE